MYRKGLAGLVAIALVAALTSAALKADPPKSPKGEETDFAGKVVAVRVKDPAVQGAVIESVQVKRLAGRAFLVGRYKKLLTDELAHPDVTYWFPIDEVVSISVFNSVEDARKDTNNKGSGPRRGPPIRPHLPPTHRAPPLANGGVSRRE